MPRTAPEYLLSVTDRPPSSTVPQAQTPSEAELQESKWYILTLLHLPFNISCPFLEEGFRLMYMQVNFLSFLRENGCHSRTTPVVKNKRNRRIGGRFAYALAAPSELPCRYRPSGAMLP